MDFSAENQDLNFLLNFPEENGIFSASDFGHTQRINPDRNPGVTHMSFQSLEHTEVRIYAKGTPVELKDTPGKVYLIEDYDPMMVPPVWLVNDPMPRYTHEIQLVSNLVVSQKVLKEDFTELLNSFHSGKR